MDGSNTNKLLRLLEQKIAGPGAGSADSITNDFFDSEFVPSNSIRIFRQVFQKFQASRFGPSSRRRSSLYAPGFPTSTVHRLHTPGLRRDIPRSANTSSSGIPRPCDCFARRVETMPSASSSVMKSGSASVLRSAGVSPLSISSMSAYCSSVRPRLFSLATTTQK